MSFDRALQRLQDIRNNILYARRFIGTLTFEEFASSELVVYATIRALEIISEASRHLPEELKARHPDIDWVAVRDSGNVYRHGYELMTERRIWDTVTKHLGDLERVVIEEIERPK